MLNWLLAIRYLVKRPITWLAVLAVTLSVFIALVVMTVMHGLVGDYKDKTHALVGDVVISTPSLVGFSYYEELCQRLEALNEVQATSAVVSAVGLRRQPGGSQAGIRIIGLDPKRHSQVTAWNAFLHYRQDQLDNAFVPSYDPNAEGFIIGIDTLRWSKNSDGVYTYSDVVPRIKLEVVCFPLTAKGAPARAGMGEINSRVLTCSDVCHTGLAREDYNVLYCSLDQAQWLCGMDGRYARANAIHFRLCDGVSADHALVQIKGVWEEFKAAFANQPTGYLLEQVRVQSWQRYHRSEIAAMEKEETMIGLMFLLVGLTTGFVVFVVFYMIVGHKSRDVGILKSIGVPDTGVMGLFSRFALLVGTCGLGLGLLSGWIFLRWINPIEDWLFKTIGWQMWNRAIYSIVDIPNEIQGAVVLRITLVALIVCLLGALAPAWKAARARPVESLQVTQV